MILVWADQSWNARSKYRRHARMSGYGLWQIEHGVNFGSLSGVLQVSLEVTSVTTYHTRHLYDGVLLVLRGSARGFWFIDPLGLRPRGLCTVATRACHVNHAPPSYNYNMNVILCTEYTV